MPIEPRGPMNKIVKLGISVVALAVGMACMVGCNHEEPNPKIETIDITKLPKGSKGPVAVTGAGAGGGPSKSAPPAGGTTGGPGAPSSN